MYFPDFNTFSVLFIIFEICRRSIVVQPNQTFTFHGVYFHGKELISEQSLVYVQEWSGDVAALNNSGMNCSLHAPLELSPVLMSFNG